MARVSLVLGCLLTVALTSPLPDPDANPQFSLPPLIPAPVANIPGFGPVAQDAPPLPVLQVPTPPLTSPPFTGSDIKPKKIGYFWTGAGDNQHAGIVLTPPKADWTE